MSEFWHPTASEVIEAVRAAAGGESRLDPTVAARVLQELRSPSQP